MVEVINPQSRIRDLTAAARRIPIDVDGGASYEIILTMWTVFNPEETGCAVDLGPKWCQGVREATPEDLATEVQALAGPNGAVLLSLLGLVAAAPHPHDPDRVLDWLGSINPQRLRRWMLGYVGEFADPGLIEQAADGDMDAVRQVISTAKGGHLDEEIQSHLISIFEIPGEELRDRLVQMIRRFRVEVFSEHEEVFTGAINRAAAAQRATSTRDSAKAEIEEVTNGLDYEIPIGVSRVTLVPSVVVKPLSLIDQSRDTLLVFYGMADEFIDSDPEAPPSWLVKTYKALSDERRLRILRRLSEEEASLDDLVDLLGLSKSTVHHHMSVLRAAGLVRVRMSGNKDHKESKTYALRTQALANAGAFLDTYVKTDEPAAS
ncbi:MAG TPA: metalloregulator ArsR/SmtB family transcription factor [Acidimicrobiia bacterium]|nr:metalloregulator ArsR/SmtB family transcription factor [Acidimicrobiia bacterium]